MLGIRTKLAQMGIIATYIQNEESMLRGKKATPTFSCPCCPAHIALHVAPPMQLKYSTEQEDTRLYVPSLSSVSHDTKDCHFPLIEIPKLAQRGMGVIQSRGLISTLEKRPVFKSCLCHQSAGHVTVQSYDFSGSGFACL